MAGSMSSTSRAFRRLVLTGMMCGLVLLASAAAAPKAEADILRGIQKIIGGVLSLPVSTLAGTFNGPPIIGTVAGALSGAVSGVGMILSGALDLAASAVPAAKAAAPYLLPFLL